MSRRGKRGPAKGNDYTYDPNRCIEFTPQGEPYGPNRADFSSGFGQEVRVCIPYHLQWNTKEVDEGDETKVTPAMLDLLWDRTKFHWNIRDDAAKQTMMNKVNKLWRGFKCELTTKFIAQDCSPFQMYPFLSKEHWPRFVATRTTEEFRVCHIHILEHFKLLCLVFKFDYYN